MGINQHSLYTMYQIKVKSQIESSLSTWFGDFAIDHTPDGNTVLIGSIVDQAALYGILIRCRDLGITLLSINPLIATETNKDSREENDPEQNDPC